MPEYTSYTLPAPRRLGWRGRLLVIVLLLALLAVGAWFAWLAIATRQQEAAIQRLREAGMPASFQELLEGVEPIPAGRDAAADILEAAELLNERGEAIEALDAWRLPLVDMSDEDREEWLALQARVAQEQAAAIERVAELDAKIRPAVDAVAADFGIWSEVKAQIEAGNPPEDPIEITLPHLIGARSLAKVLAADARSAGAAGDSERALTQVIRLVGIGEAIDADAYALVEHLVAIGPRLLGAQAAMETAREGIGDSDPALRARATAAFMDVGVLEAGLGRALRGEAAFELEIMRALDEGRIGIAEVAGGRARRGEAWLVRLTRPILRGDVATIADYQRAAYEATKADDFPAAVARVPDPDAMAPHTYLDVYARVLIAGLDRTVEANYRCRTEMHAAAAALAIAAYRADNGGRWPESLEALVPDYLPELPRDAMARGAPPIRYDPARRILWSVGIDAEDDGGDATSTRASGDRASLWDGEDVVVELY